MINMVGIRFQQDGKMLYYNAGETKPHVGDFVLAETDHGLDLGEVLLGVKEIDTEESVSSLPHVVRIATQQDIQQAADNRARERDAYQICQRKINEHNLEMKLVSVECTFDDSKMLFYFTANGRVDFRALVKDLASTFKTRIELRQIGVRDEARMLGGLGPCGRPICCGSFLTDFQPVSIKMAKEQNLSLNPTKISGVCGRLMCCLKYEEDQYEQVRKKMPRVGREVMTPDGKGTVCDLNIIKETVSVRIPAGDATEIRIYTIDQITRPGTEESAHIPSGEKENCTDEILIQNEVQMATVLSVQNSNNSEIESNQSEEKAMHLRTKKERTDKKQSHSGVKEQKKNEDLSDNDQKKSGSSAQTRNSSRSREKASKESKIGQPVRRENRDRNKSRNANAAEKKENSKTEEIKKQQNSEISTPTVRKQQTDKSKGWADALEKAIQAADRE